MGVKQDLRPCRFGLGLSIEPSFSVFYEGKSVCEYVEAVLSDGNRKYQWSASGMSAADIISYISGMYHVGALNDVEGCDKN